jgi:cysteine-rich repeat protein
MEHCQNTQHEDHAMLLRWDIERPGQLALLPTPIPTWDGVELVDTVALPTFRTGDLDAADAPPAICGDGVLDTVEQCDDGNNIDSDGCSAACFVETLPGNFAVSIDRATDHRKSDRWRVQGTSDAPGGSTVEVHFGNDLSGPLLVSPVIQGDQSWDEMIKDAAIVATEGSNVTAVPSAGGIPQTYPVTVR